MLSIKLSENAGRAPEAVPFMPAGQHSICATVNGKPGRRLVTVDREACDRLQADLSEHLRASAAGEKARPMLMFDHTAGNAAAKPLGFEWDDERGILLRVEWTQAGRDAVEGGNYGYVSPAFRLAKGTGEILGLAGGVEVGSLVNDPAFERNECIAASRTEEPEDVQVDYVETANPYGSNQHGHREGHKGGAVEKADSDKKNNEKSNFFSSKDAILELLDKYRKENEERGKELMEKYKKNPEAFILDGRKVIERMEKEREYKDEDEWLRKNRGTQLFKMTKEDHIAWLEHKIQKEKERAAKHNDKPSISHIEDEIKRLREDSNEDKNKSTPEYLLSSVPPRAEVEKNEFARDNADVANGGGENSKTKMETEAIKKALGLSPDADNAAVLSAIRALKTQGAEAKTRTEQIEAECEQHKKALKEHKEKSADAFVKRLNKGGIIGPHDEEKAKAARTLFLADPEQAETLFAGMRTVQTEILSDKVHANRVPSSREMSAAEILQSDFEANN